MALTAPMQAHARPTAALAMAGIRVRGEGARWRVRKARQAASLGAIHALRPRWGVAALKPGRLQTRRVVHTRASHSSPEEPSSSAESSNGNGSDVATQAPAGAQKETPAEPTKFRVALVGSSGGGAATLGSSEELMTLVEEQLGFANMQLVAVQMVSTNVPLDVAAKTSPATLWTMDERGLLIPSSTAPLEAINQLATHVDAFLAARLLIPPSSPDHIHALVAVSADVNGANRLVMEAAAAVGTPVVGTGGTSLGLAGAQGVHVIGSSGGSVATTSLSKAINFVSILSSHFKSSYHPHVPIRWSLLQSSLVGCLPAILCVHVFCTVVNASAAELLKVVTPGVEGLPMAFTNCLAQILSSATAAAADAPFLLPVVVSAVGANQVAKCGEVGLIAGVLAGGLLSVLTAITQQAIRGGILGGLVTGLVCGVLVPHMLARCSRLGFPATAATILTSGAVGITVGLVAALTVTPFTAAFSLYLEQAVSILFALKISAPWLCAGIGAALSMLFVYLSKRGAYHYALLPMILVEMEQGNASFLGALDQIALVAVCAGLCAASVLAPRESGGDASPAAEKAAAMRGLKINTWFGDYVEACYPYMQRDKWVNLGAYAAAAVGGAVAAMGGVRSTAYLPAPLLLVLSDTPVALGAALAVTVGITFTIAYFRNRESLKSVYASYGKQGSVDDINATTTI